MVKVSSLFSQLLQHFNRNEFAALVKKHGAEWRRERFFLSDAIRVHDVLPTGACGLASGDMQRAELLPRQSEAFGHSQSPEQIHPFLRERTPTSRALRGPVFFDVQPFPEQRWIWATQEKIPV